MGVGNWHRQPNKMCQVSAMLQLEFMQSAPARRIENDEKKEKAKNAPRVFCNFYRTARILEY